MIGCGIFGFGVIGYFLDKNHGRVIRGVLDSNVDRAASFYQRYGLDYYTTDPEKLLNDPAIDLVYIASNHLSHAEYAIRALENGKAVHIEKPHVVTESQLRRLCATMVRTGGKVRLGFNRPRSPLGRLIKEQLHAQTGTAMMNWSVAGAPLPPDHWYYKPEEGGRVVGNLCHYTDFIFQMTPPEKRYPIVIQPTKYDRPDENIAVTYLFGDGSIGVITFSTKGEPFEGDKERFSAHRDDCLIAMRRLPPAGDRGRDHEARHHAVLPRPRPRRQHERELRDGAPWPRNRAESGLRRAVHLGDGALHAEDEGGPGQGRGDTIERGFDPSLLER